MPTESKKLIAKGIVELEVVQKALKEGLVVIHPSSSTFFIVGEITGKTPITKPYPYAALPCTLVKDTRLP